MLPRTFMTMLVTFAAIVLFVDAYHVFHNEDNEVFLIDDGQEAVIKSSFLCWIHPNDVDAFSRGSSLDLDGVTWTRMYRIPSVHNKKCVF
jgi:hypothetical protein